MSRPVKPEPFANTPKPAGDRPTSLSIDAQLSELLGDVEPAAGGAPAVGGKADRSPAPFGTPPKSEVAPNSSDVGPSLVVTRTGFMPETRSPKSDDVDPFDFDLGPSPFASKLRDEPKVGSVKPLPSTLAASLPEGGSVSNAASEPVAKDRAEAGPSAPETKPTEEEQSPGKEAARQVSEAESPKSSEASPFSFAAIAKSIETTPTKPEASAVSSSDATQASSESVRSEAPKRDVMEFAEALKSAEAQDESKPAAVPTPSAVYALMGLSGSQGAETDDVPLPPENMHSGLPATATEGQQRTMEDTVADLLRPMLRTWLAENMPRIVERALMREINAQIPSDRKSETE